MTDLHIGEIGESLSENSKGRTNSGLISETSSTEEPLQYHHLQRDQKENLAISPPPGEEVNLRALWVVEAYSPGKNEALNDGIAKLNWIDDYSFGRETKKNDWIKEARQTGGFSWQSLPLLNPTGNRKYLGAHLIDGMPEGVSSIRGGLFQIIPSITLLVAQFIFEETTAKIYEEPLQKTYSTYTEKVAAGTSNISPPSTKNTSN